MLFQQLLTCGCVRARGWGWGLVEWRRRAGFREKINGGFSVHLLQCLPAPEKETYPLCNVSNLCSGVITIPVTFIPTFWLWKLWKYFKNLTSYFYYRIYPLPFRTPFKTRFKMASGCSMSSRPRPDVFNLFSLLSPRWDFQNKPWARGGGKLSWFCGAVFGKFFTPSPVSSANTWSGLFLFHGKHHFGFCQWSVVSLASIHTTAHCNMFAKSLCMLYEIQSRCKPSRSNHNKFTLMTF